MKKLFILLFISVLGFSACEVDEVLNPNSPTVEAYENGATLADLQLLAQGLEATIRGDMQFHFWSTSILGREYYDLRGTDPRYTGELLGQNGGELDIAGFLTTRTYFGRFRSVRNAILLRNAVQNTAATLSTEEVNSFNGFANTLTGYELLLEATRQFENGIRIDVDDPDNLGEFTRSFQESLNGIKGYLDDGYSQLTGASEDFLFSISGDGFSTIPGWPSSQTEAFATFNRALAARVELYLGNSAGVLSALEDSFMNFDQDMDIGAFYSFGGATGNDQTNPLFYVPGVDNYMAHPTFIEDAEDGDGRLSKATLAELIELDGLSGDHQVTLYASNSSPASIIRNEELILMFAEANIGSDNAAAVMAINVVRSSAGLPDFESTDTDEITAQLIHERRYSLFGEGHRWIDMRRWDMLDELPLDRDGDKVHVQFPRPASEGLIICMILNGSLC